MKTAQPEPRPIATRGGSESKLGRGRAGAVPDVVCFTAELDAAGYGGVTARQRENRASKQGKSREDPFMLVCAWGGRILLVLRQPAFDLAVYAARHLKHGPMCS